MFGSGRRGEGRRRQEGRQGDGGSAEMQPVEEKKRGGFAEEKG